MPTNVNVASAARLDGAVVETAVLNFTGQFTQWSGTLTGLGSGPGSDYENPANALDIGIYDETAPGSGVYVEFAGFRWQGGPSSHGGVTDPPPPFSFSLTNLPHGNVRVRFSVTGNFTVGLSSTLS